MGTTKCLYTRSVRAHLDVHMYGACGFGYIFGARVGSLIRALVFVSMCRGIFMSDFPAGYKIASIGSLQDLGTSLNMEAKYPVCSLRHICTPRAPIPSLYLGFLLGLKFLGKVVP